MVIESVILDSGEVLPADPNRLVITACGVTLVGIREGVGVVFSASDGRCWRRVTRRSSGRSNQQSTGSAYNSVRLRKAALVMGETLDAVRGELEALRTDRYASTPTVDALLGFA